MNEKILRRATLVFPQRKDGWVLLARKQRHIGAGLWNGYGGGFNEGENVRRCALRELAQESGMTARSRDLVPAACVDFHNRTSEGRRFTCRVFVFLLPRFRGEPRASAEMAQPRWFFKQELPLEEMMPADRHWLPLALRGEHFFAEAWYGPRQEALEKEVRLVRLSQKNLARLFE